MTDVNKIEAAGFKTDKNGNVITQSGHKVSKDVAEQVVQGNILSNFNLDELRKRKARAAATGSADLVSALNTISPAIALLQVGQTAKIAIPKSVAGGKDPKRSFIMGIVTKLNNLTQKGREWEGKVFDTLSDPEGDFAYVARLDDTDTPHVRKSGGGRKKANSMDRLAKASEKVEQELGEKTEQESAEVTEEATVVKH